MYAFTHKIKPLGNSSRNYVTFDKYLLKNEKDVVVLNA